MSDLNNDEEVSSLLEFLIKAASGDMTLEVVGNDGRLTLTIPENNYGDPVEQKHLEIEMSHDGKFFLGG